MQDETQEIIDGNYKSSQEQLDLGLKTLFSTNFLNLTFRLTRSFIQDFGRKAS
jgi:hypothetical protein